MRYLWQVPHALDDAYLRELLPDYRSTPIEQALIEALGIETKPAQPQSVLATV